MRLKLLVLFVAFVLVAVSSFGVSVSGQIPVPGPTITLTPVTPYPTPDPLLSCWIFMPDYGILQQCDELPCRPGEPCAGTGTLPKRGEYTVFLPGFENCPGIIMAIDGESVVIKNRTCADLDINRWMLTSNGSGAICRIAGRIENNRQVSISPLNCGYYYPVWTGKITLYNKDGQAVSSTELR